MIRGKHKTNTHREKEGEVERRREKERKETEMWNVLKFAGIAIGATNEIWIRLNESESYLIKPDIDAHIRWRAADDVVCRWCFSFLTDSCNEIIELTDKFASGMRTLISLNS